MYRTTGYLWMISLDTNLITPELLSFYSKKHAAGPYGTSAAGAVGASALTAIKGQRLKTLLDYGAGNRSLERLLKQHRPDIKVTSYDPAIPEIAKKPAGPFDMVTCIDCLEHIEPALVDNVLDDIFQLATSRVFLHIACRPAKVIMPDGRNAHLIIESPDWWVEKVGARGTIVARFDKPPNNAAHRWHSVDLTLDKK